jgi:hypothetical protein
MQRTSVHKTAIFFLTLVLGAGLAFTATAEQKNTGEGWTASTAPVDSDVCIEADFGIEIDPTGWTK